MCATVAFAADREVKVDDRLHAGADTLIEIMRASDHGIPLEGAALRPDEKANRVLYGSYATNR